MSAFSEKTGARSEASTDTQTAAGTNRRIQGTSKVTQKEQHVSHITAL